MKNIKDKAAIKQARKALKKQIKEKLVIQIETLVSEFGPDVSKAKKAIDKAAKNLAKILAAKLRPEAHAAPAEPKAKKGKKQPTLHQLLLQKRLRAKQRKIPNLKKPFN
ncbi:hypothetical protein ACRQ5D_30560 [Mucilaginibacter sp. P25]|uniref:hypothetical protein n=1 Tax=unclassified Mucilaginibacter TaxID=2617802 RepID=UPI003D67BE11